VEIDISLGRDEVSALLAEATPVRVHLGGTDDDRRFVELEPPSEVSFVAGQGVRIVTRGRVRHELAGVGLPFGLRRVQFLCAPAVVTGPRGPRLDFPLHVEEADLENVPGLIETVVISKVNEALNPDSPFLCWDLAPALARIATLPERFEPLDRFLTAARWAQATVTEQSLILRVKVGLSISRTRARPIDGSATS
jgi:hypothetical protein